MNILALLLLYIAIVAIGDGMTWLAAVLAVMAGVVLAVDREI